MIHPALSKTEIAFRYYKDKFYNLDHAKLYSRETALKMFHKEKHIDNKLVMSIIKDIFKEQKEMMK